MSELDRRPRRQFAFGFLLVALRAWGLALLISPDQGEAAQAQQTSILTGSLEDLDLGNLSIRRFRFTAGSRLSWHTHVDGSQLLMMEDGKGRMQERGGPVIEMLPDDPRHARRRRALARSRARRGGNPVEHLRWHRRARRRDMGKPRDG